MEELENNEKKILIDALKYTSNIIIDLTNKITVQEEKIMILENKLNKIQKLTLENNLKLKTINFDEIYNINKIISSFKNKKNNIDSDEISEFILEKKYNDNNQSNPNQSNPNQSNPNQSNPNQSNPNQLDNILADKNKIDRLIGSIVKRKNNLNEIINENKNNLDEIIYEKKKLENSGIDFTIRTATNKSLIDGTIISNELINEKEQEQITKAHDNDLDKANNILKQIRRRANIKKM